MPDLPFCFLIQ